MTRAPQTFSERKWLLPRRCGAPNILGCRSFLWPSCSTIVSSTCPHRKTTGRSRKPQEHSENPGGGPNQRELLSNRVIGSRRSEPRSETSTSRSRPSAVTRASFALPRLSRSGTFQRRSDRLLDIGRPLWAQRLGLGLPPVGDHLGQAELLDPGGLLPAVDGPIASAAEMLAHHPLGDTQDAGGLGGGLASLVQDLNRHDLLPRELGQGAASKRSG
jgi:hypothetical protein